MKTEVRVRIKREAEEEVAVLVPWEVAKLLERLPVDLDLEYVVVEKRRVEQWQTIFERLPEGATDEATNR